MAFLVGTALFVVVAPLMAAFKAAMFAVYFCFYVPPVVGIERWCALDHGQWQCNYETREQCVSYNEICSERVPAPPTWM
jgi:hypothetical protein